MSPAFVSIAIPLFRHPLRRLSASTLPRPSHSPDQTPLRLHCTAQLPTAHRLSALRTQLRERNVQAIIIPSADAHASEYVSDCFARRAFISLFDGSAGTAVVTLNAAHLWTDGRYFLQAEQQLDENWTLMRAGLPDTPPIPDFLADTLPQGAAVAIDPFLHSIDSANAIVEAVEKKGCKMISLQPPNPVDLVWHDRPSLPTGAVREHPIHFAGSSVQDKLAKIREQMAEKDCQHMLVSMLDEVCWLFNIRGSDIPHCPVVLSYGLVSHDAAYLYIDENKIEPAVTRVLQQAGVTIRGYDTILDDVRSIVENDQQKIWLDPSSTSLALSDAAAEAGIREPTPLPLAKARKNEAELHGMRQAHLRDGVALSSFLCWLEDYVKDGSLISEVTASNKLDEFRAQQSGFLTTSFETIPGSGANGAIIHYRAIPGQCGQISNKEVFLLDSGGQYEDGTTDVTRTMHLGAAASDHQRECYTRVLQGHIGIDTAVFPEDTTGLMLDTLARVPLWSIGLDYRHGTGHGVGACLNVHEGPHSISPRLGSNKAGLKTGMIVSNEPGYYEDGSFGIRIENLLIVVEKSTAHEFGGNKFLGFERLTHVPIDKSMIIPSLLSSSEVEWLDGYHADVWNKLSPLMEEGRYKDWLWEKTRPLVLNDVVTERAPDTTVVSSE